MKRSTLTLILTLVLLTTLNAGFTQEFTQSYVIDILDVNVEASVIMDDVTATAETEVTLSGSTVDLLPDDIHVSIYFLDEDGFPCVIYSLGEQELLRTSGSMTFSEDIPFYHLFLSWDRTQTSPYSFSSISISIPALLRMEEMADADGKLDAHEKLNVVPPFLYGCWNLDGAQVFFMDDRMRIGRSEALLQGRGNDSLSIQGFYAEKDLFIAGIRYNRQNMLAAFVSTNDADRVDVYLDGKYLTTMRRSSNV